MTATSWVDGARSHGFGLQTLPFGSFRLGTRMPSVGIAIGGQVLDLGPVLTQLDPSRADLAAPGNLDAILAAGPTTWAHLRERLTLWLSDTAFREVVTPHLHDLADVTMLLPFTVADYVDFYSSQHHATNVGRMFRPDEDPLPPNWKHLPIGYHGRAGTVVVGGTDIVRPSGQLRLADGSVEFGPSARLDIEAELGYVVGTPSRLGEPVPIRDFEQHVFGVCLVNDWSARDIQAWEYKPLGPFLGKSFATSIGPWVIPLAALVDARIAGPQRDPTPLPYLDDHAAPWSLDVTFEVVLNGTVISAPTFREMYWTGAQQMAHMTVNGASLRTGDLYASGTVSGPDRSTWGSLLELSWGGAEPLELADGTARTFLEDGDTVTIRASAPGPNGTRVDLGEVAGAILPAHRA